MDKKILVSMMVIGLVAALAGAGLYAYFSDTETSSGNTFTAGTLDLILGGSTLPFSVSNTYPGASGKDNVTLRNGGSLPGVLDVKVTNVTNTGALDRSPTVTGEFCDHSGDLGGALEIAIWLDIDNDGLRGSSDFGLNYTGGIYDPSVGLQYAPLNNYNNTVWNNIRTMASSDVDTFIIEWQIPGTVGNAIQGDMVTFDVVFQLRQSGAPGLE
jgi:predicted ribosomally synthesized peptide with SipW-like signal peptide